MVTSAKSIPMMSATSDARRLREGARLLSTFLSAAQTRAVATGRSTGVVIQRQKNNNMASMDLFMAETPPPYIGDGSTSVAMVQWASGATNGTVTFNPQTDPSFTSQRIRPGDMVRFNYRGQLYFLDPNNTLGANPYITTMSGIPIYPTDATNYQSPVANPQTGVPFQIFRQPVKTLDAPAQIVDGAAVDLYYSGVDNNVNGSGQPSTSFPSSGFSAITSPNFFSADTRPIIVTFSPTGALEYVYAMGLGCRPVSGVYFLIGKAQNIPQPPASGGPPTPATPNWTDLDCKWVSISRQTGLVTVSEVRGGSAGPAANFVASRFFAQGGQSSTGN